MPILHGSGIYLLKLAAMQRQLPCLLGYKKPYFQINLYWMFIQFEGIHASVKL